MFWSARFRDDTGWTDVLAVRATRHRAEPVRPTRRRNQAPPVVIGANHGVTGISDAQASSPGQSAHGEGWRGRVALLKAWDRDVRLGAGMVAAFCVIVATTTPALHLGIETSRTVVLTVLGIAIVDFGLLLLRWDRYAQRMLLAFPILLLIGELLLAVYTKGVSADYTGFLTLGFVYIGLTQPVWDRSRLFTVRRTVLGYRPGTLGVRNGDQARPDHGGLALTFRHSRRADHP